MGNFKKVLIIEGGGAFGIIPAKFMADAERGDYERYNKEIASLTCMGGCSIGGALALAYASGRDPKFMLEYFLQNMERCFTKRCAAKVNPIACPTYRSDTIEEVFNEIYGNDTMSIINEYYPQLKVFIPSLDITQNSYKVFDNYSVQDADARLADVARYTTAAPTYFAGKEYNGRCIVDGGLIEVLPLFTTITGLRKATGIELKDMDVLVLGCGNASDEIHMDTEEYNSKSLIGVATNLIVPYVTKSNAIASKFWGENIGLHSFEYYNPVTISGGMDSVTGMYEAYEDSKNYTAEFIDVWKKFISK